MPRPVFVVQRHQARSLHYDLRLEVDGALASWAVPKEPSTDPAVKRLAVRVDDHAMAHATHESPTVEIWDSGWYEPVTEGPVAEALADGHLRFSLHGDRLAGDFALTRTAMNGDDRNWILVKVAGRP